MPDTRIHVAVLYGGRSSEHSISCISAGSILRAIDPDRFRVTAIGITDDGRWFVQDADPERMQVIDGALPFVEATGTPVTLSPDSRSQPGILADVNVVFPVLHGSNGEDGTIQGLLELARIPYVGSGVLASAAAMDKGVMKALLAAAGLEVGPYRVITDQQWRHDAQTCVDALAELGLPVFVKPARSGSSRGISKVTAREELRPAIELAREHDPRVVVESAIGSFREIECAVLADRFGNPMASCCAEIIVQGPHEFYDFDAKYLDGSAELVVPASLSGEVEARVKALAIQAFLALGCEGLARVDFFVLDSGQAIVNEVNTMPGFTAISMYPRMWRASGIEYGQLVSALLDDALRRGTGLR